MSGTTIKIRSSGGGEFDCYLALPAGDGQRPAIVLAAAVHGVDKDIRDLADEFAGARLSSPPRPTCSGARSRDRSPGDDERTKERSQPRLEKIKAGEADMVDTLAHLRTLPQFNGRAATMGFCYGGPYAILGPKRLGYAAGISCHGTRMLDFIDELKGVTAPVCIIWGDQDHAAPAEVLDAYRAVPARMPNVEVHIFPGVLHGYMMPWNTKAFSAETRAFTMGRALAILDGLCAAAAISCAGRRDPGAATSGAAPDTSVWLTASRFPPLR